MRHKESLTDNEVKEEIENYAKIFGKRYVESDWKGFKKRADIFLKKGKQLNNLPVDVSNGLLSERIENGLYSRIFLGIGMELLLKSIYLKNGYSINVVDDNSLKKIKSHKNKIKPFKIKQIPKKYVHPIKTQTIGGLLKNLKKVHDFSLSNNEFNSKIFMGLKIFETWRNKDAHVGGGYHMEDSSCWLYTQESLKNIYLSVFNENFLLWE